MFICCSLRPSRNKWNEVMTNLWSHVSYGSHSIKIIAKDVVISGVKTNWLLSPLSRKSIFVRPCVRRNFPNFSFSRVSEMFGCRSSEIFGEKWNFRTRGIFAKKFGKKFGMQGLKFLTHFNLLTRNCLHGIMSCNVTT